MKKTLIIALALILPLGWCSLPIRSVATVAITIQEPVAATLSERLKGELLDETSQSVLQAEATELLERQRLDFWSNGNPEDTTVDPATIYTAKAAKISGANCKEKVIPLAFIKEYIPLSFSPHGGGSAYWHYHATHDISLECGAPKENL